MHLRLAVFLALAGVLSVDPSGLAATGPTLKRDAFDRDPDWEGFNNHVAPKKTHAVAQDFGYSSSNFAGKDKGEIGGTVWRSSTRASYSASVPQKTLHDKLTASGTFAITETSGSSGAFFGWFNAEQTGNGRRDTLGFRFSGQGSGARLTLQLVTDKNQACGTKVTPWVVDRSKPKGEGRKYRPTAIKNDGTRYHWTLAYDPNANGGNGEIQFTIRSDSSTPDAFETKTHTVALPVGYKEQGTVFNRLGLMNSERGGNAMSIYFDDLSYDGNSEDFARDPGWLGSGNHAQFEDRTQGGAHDFGFSAKTSHAGGSPGEIGGTIWRSGFYGYYADRVGLLTLTNRLEASGKVVLEAAPPDSGVYLGWFNSGEKENSPAQAGSFVGIKIGGPTRVGHYFAPAYATDKKTAQTQVKLGREREHEKRVSVERRDGPLLVPQRVFDWKLIYDPSADSGVGAIEARLGDQSVTLPLKRGDKNVGATFDRFGLFTSHIGGSYVKIFFDDLVYTTAAHQ
jgi:hypothetical protein